MASQTQTSAKPELLFPALKEEAGLAAAGLAVYESDYQEELSFYEGTLRAAEDDAGLTLRRLDVEPGCKIGDNYSSIVTRNTAHGVSGDGSAYRRSLIVKRAPQLDQFRCLAAFSKETDAYCTLVPLMLGVCRDAGLQLPLARCLHASQRLRPDLIVLEDLAAQGYSMRPRQQGLDRDHALLTMKALGRFHGVSLSLRRLQPRVFRKLRAQTGELIFFPAAQDVFSRSLHGTMTLAILSLRQSGRDDLAQRLAERVARRGVFQEMCDVVVAPTDEDAVEPVFTHGDCWANNLLFKYDVDGRPCETRLIDLAGIRCASPALDILHLMFTSLPRDVRREHRDELLQEYIDALHDTIAKIRRGSLSSGSSTRHNFGWLENCGTSPAQAPEKEVLRIEQLRQELRTRAAFGLWIGLWMLPAIFFSPDIMPDPELTGDYFSDEYQAYMCKLLPKEFHLRLLDLVEEHDEDGLL